MRILWPIPVAVAAIAFVILASLGIENPGVEYDEVLFANAALGIKDHSFIAWALRFGPKNVALMLMPYIGAVKAYLYFPVLHLFGGSPGALRLPSVVVGAAALLVFALVGRRIAGARAAVLFALLLATDPSYIYHLRLDWGPVALAMLLKATGTYLFLQWWDTGRARWLAISGLSLGLGIYDKVNFVWFPLGAGLAALLVYHRELRARATLRTTALFGGCVVLGALPLLLYNVAFPLVTLREPFEAGGAMLSAGLDRRAGAMADALLGTAVFRFVNAGDVVALWDRYLPGADGPLAALAAALTSSPLGRGSLFGTAALLAALYLVGRSLLWPRRADRAVVALLVTSLLILLQIAITRKATGSYHAVMLYPMPHLMVAIALVHLWERGGGFSMRKGSAPRTRPMTWASGLRTPLAGVSWPRLLGTVLAATVLASNLLVDGGYLRYFAAEGGRGIWSSAIYDLAAYARARTADRLVLMDWGFNTQLLALSSGTIDKDEVYHWLTDGRAERERFEVYLRDPVSLFVFHTPEYTVAPRARALFTRLLAEKELSEEIVQTFYQKNGEPVYYVSQVKSAK